MLKIPLGVARIKINVDAEVMELCLPKDCRIQTKSATTSRAIAEKVEKPVICLQWLMNAYTLWGQLYDNCPCFSTL